MKKKILSFLDKNELMVLSTLSSKGYPQSAVVGYSETPDLEIIFGTFKNTRKYRNLRKNKRVSAVFGWDLKKKITVQYEGIAKEITNERKLDLCKKIHIAKNPKREKHANNPKEKIFKIKPKWIRYSNLSKKPEEIFEISF